MTLDIRALRPDEASPLGLLTFPAYRPILAGQRAIAVGLFAGDEPAGLALGVVSPDDGTSGRLLSLLVCEPHRGRGMGTRLVTAFEAEAARRGCTRLTGKVTGSTDRVLPVERLLERAGWQFSGPTSILCAATQESMISAPWLAHATLPSDMEVFPWLELSAVERAEMLAHQQRAPWIPPLLSPFWNEPLIAGCSVGLRHRGRVAGWCVTYRFEGDTVRWLRLFVEPSLQRMARALPLLAETIRRAPDYGFHHGLWSVSADNAAMMRLLKRRMWPYLHSGRPVWATTRALDQR